MGRIHEGETKGERGTRLDTRRGGETEINRKKKKELD